MTTPELEETNNHPMKFNATKTQDLSLILPDPHNPYNLDSSVNTSDKNNLPDEEAEKDAEEEVKLRIEEMELNYKPLDADEQCGCFSLFRSPKWLQKFATRRTFLFIFCLSSVMQGMFFTYFVSCLTTIEKLFQIQTKTIGMIMSTTEVGQIGGGLLLAYFAGNGHRPRWIAGGMILFAFSVLLCSSPHFLFGNDVLANFLASAPTLEDPLATANICNDSIWSTIPNETLSEAHDRCSDLTGNSRVVLSLFFVALLGVGLGQTALFNIGIPYLDDNISNADSPTYFGTTIGVRIFGPTLGFVLGSLCTRMSIDPFSEPKFDPTDPRWIGAWWLGLVMISFGLLLVSFLMMMFPKNLPKEKKTLKDEVRYSSVPKISLVSKGCYQSLRKEFTDNDDPVKESNPEPTCDSVMKNGSNWNETEVPFIEKEGPVKTEKSFKDFLLVLCRLSKNKVLVLRTASSVLHILPISGLYTFLPKYLETQFRLTVHSAAMISGVGGILVMGLGIFVSGFVIRKLSPSPRCVAGWIAITAFLYSVGMIILVFLGCSNDNVIQTLDPLSTTFEPLCNTNCTACDTSNFAPICSSEGLTYFSACHAGCSSVGFADNSTDLLFEDCFCLGDGVTATLRFCETNCPNLAWYVAIFCIIVIIHSTSEVGGMLVTLRCVKAEDKVMALGFISVAIGLFGNVPCPILYGGVIDKACIHNKESCGIQGACQIYDPDLFSQYFHGITAALMLAAFVFDVAVWYYAKDISFSDEDETENNKNKQNIPDGDILPFHLNEEEVEKELKMFESSMKPLKNSFLDSARAPMLPCTLISSSDSRESASLCGTLDSASSSDIKKIRPSSSEVPTPLEQMKYLTSQSKSTPSVNGQLTK